MLLPSPSKIATVVHLAAMPSTDVTAFFARLKNRETVSARALAFTILTAARSGEARLATFAEIDFKAAIWNVPAERMKSGRLHRVPLSNEALTLLPRDGEPDSLPFPSTRAGALSDVTMRKYLQ